MRGAKEDSRLTQSRFAPIRVVPFSLPPILEVAAAFLACDISQGQVGRISRSMMLGGGTEFGQGAAGSKRMNYKASGTAASTWSLVSLVRESRELVDEDRGVQARQYEGQADGPDPIVKPHNVPGLPLLDLQASPVKDPDAVNSDSYCHGNGDQANDVRVHIAGAGAPKHRRGDPAQDDAHVHPPQEGSLVRKARFGLDPHRHLSRQVPPLPGLSLHQAKVSENALQRSLLLSVVRLPVLN